MTNFDERNGSWIEDVAEMAPFFMSLVSGGDRWMYLASTGGLTAGRRDPDGALFPYETDDRLCAADGTVGARTVVWASRGGERIRWEPFLRAADGLQPVHRRLWKSSLGDEIVFEERHDALRATIRWSWRSGARFGFVRTAELRNDGDQPLAVRMLDGLLGVMPACVERSMQAGYSNLVDAYKIAEREAGSSLALFRLSSIPIDRAMPNEALWANAAWIRGLPAPTLLLSPRQLRAFRLGQPVQEEFCVRGSPGALLACSEFSLGAGETMRWMVGVDGKLDAAAAIALARDLGAGHGIPTQLDHAIRADFEADRARLLAHVAAVDGLQATGDLQKDKRHLANALFNAMRGGVFLDEGRVRVADFARYLREVAPALSQRVDVSGFPDGMTRRELVERAVALGDVDLERLAREYLPLTFSRRHGDPSRPWNLFALDTHDPDGSPRMRYEGNWRDIFQNWEALLHAFPAYAEAAVVKFIDATTRDGFNPYRVSREGFDWERPDPSDPWAHIGYWGDHQIVYLQRLLDVCARHEPGSLAQLLRRRMFVFADVPYRIADHDRIVADPHETIAFDAARDAAIRAMLPQLGNEARLVPAAEGERRAPLRATLAEKLMVPILAKLGQFVPGLGIWMNTQRPEWNDANNALVGRGVSVVTAAQLVRHCQAVESLFAAAGSDPVAMTQAAAEWVAKTLAAMRSLGASSPRAFLDRLSRLAADYRSRVYRNGPDDNEAVSVAVADVVELLQSARRCLVATVRDNLRDDGLVHSYNLMELEGADGMRVRRLPAMLEGQVAAIASGALSPSECADLLDALRRSPLRRQDLGSYLLYPDREVAPFPQKGVVPDAALRASPAASRLVGDARSPLLRKGHDGVVRFAPDLRNKEALVAVCAKLSVPAADAQELARLYEQVFDHAAFTGRSGSFFGYEGLGSIYWHMVSKLRLAVLESWIAANDAGADEGVRARLMSHYDDVTRGLGAESDPKQYGAFPSDPYSHTPAHAGARKPGMTGQVKEDLVARRLELGLRVDDGCLSFRPSLVRPSAPLPLPWQGRIGRDAAFVASQGCVAFSVCGAPATLRPAAKPCIELRLADGTSVRVDGPSLDREWSRRIFDRTGSIVRLDVSIPVA